LSARGLTSSLDGLHDLNITRAAAEVPCQRVPYLLLGRVRVFIQKPFGGHDHPWRAVAALDSSFFHEGLLQGVEFAARFKAGENLFLHANYSYLHMETPVLAAPGQQFNLTVNYTYKIFNLNLSAQHIGNLYTSVNPEITESYTLLNARVNARILKNLNIFFSANNLLNREYEINYGYPMPKLNFNAGIRVSF